MAPPYPPTPGYQPPPAAAGNDKSLMYGIIGLIVGFLCCQPAGIVLGVLSMNEAKKYGKPTTLGLIAVIVSSIWLVLGLIIGIAQVASA